MVLSEFRVDGSEASGESEQCPVLNSSRRPTFEERVVEVGSVHVCHSRRNVWRIGHRSSSRRPLHVGLTDVAVDRQVEEVQGVITRQHQENSGSQTWSGAGRA